MEVISSRNRLLHGNEHCTDADVNIINLKINLNFCKKLRLLEAKGMAIQYQLACLSTLGGAYHLTNRPDTAFMIAYRQELVGRMLGSMSVIIRAKVFQAVNLYLLGHRRKSDQLFKLCKKLATENSWVGMLPFVTACELWLRNQHIASRDGTQQLSLRGAIDAGDGQQWQTIINVDDSVIMEGTIEAPSGSVGTVL